MVKPEITVNDDGTLHYAFPPDTHVVFTGPIKGVVTLADGTVHNVSPDYIAVDSPEHAAEVAHLIGVRHVAEGHPAHDAENPFVYTPPVAEEV